MQPIQSIKNFLKQFRVIRLLARLIRPKPKEIDSLWHLQKLDALESLLNFLEGVDPHQPKWPTEVFLEVSNLCDLKCAMCPTFSPLSRNRFANFKLEQRGLMSMEKLEPHIEQLLQHALIVHAFGYGEPTINPKFKLLLERLSYYEVWIDFFTHGMHLDEEFSQFLVQKRIGRITVSFSGATKEDYENIYIDGDFDKVLANLRRLNEIKKEHNAKLPQIHVNSIAFEHHVAKFPQFVTLMAEHGVELIHLKPLTSHGSIPQLHGHSAIFRPEVEGKILAKAREIGDELGVQIASNHYEAFQVTSEEEARQARERKHKGDEQLSDQVVPIDQLKLLAKELSKQEKEARSTDAPIEKRRKEILSEEVDWLEIPEGKKVCMEPYKTFYITLNGDVKPCCFSASYSRTLGNIFVQDEIWNNPAFRKMREGAVNRRYPKEVCASCIKTDSYPKMLDLGAKVRQYSMMFNQRFGVPFHTHLLRRASKYEQRVRAREAKARGESPPDHFFGNLRRSSRRDWISRWAKTSCFPLFRKGVGRKGDQGRES
jgi:radical SAM protein with 4Fe4S-binding SPASM domain